jgi:hypothetical protein
MNASGRVGEGMADTYDPACADLARHFLQDQPGATADDTETIDALALEIQQTIEAFLTALEDVRAVE